MLSADAMIRLFLILLYAPACIVSFRFLLPRLLPSAKRLAIALLAAQVVVIVLSQELRHTYGYEPWLLDLDREGNLPASLASTQLALVAMIALLTAWHARGRPAWHRLYLVGVGVVFLHLARDEFFGFHENLIAWQVDYTRLGAVIVAATLLVAASSPRRTWRWHIFFLIGLAISIAGAIIVEEYRYEHTCRSLQLLRADGCATYVLEESLEFLGIWFVLAAMLGQFSDVAPPQTRRRQLLYLLPALWVLHFHIPYLIHFVQFRFHSPPEAITYESDLELRIYRLDHDESSVVLQLFSLPRTWQDYTPLGYSLHLVDQVSGSSIAGIDNKASRRHSHSIPSIPYPIPIRRFNYKQWLEIPIPPEAPRNRALWVVLTTWREEGDEFVRQKIISSDYPLLGGTQVILAEIVLPAESVVSSSTPVAVFENGFSLDAVEIPERARRGETLTVPFAWRSDKDNREEYVQFLHFRHEENGAWWVYDQQPLGARLPTRLWYDGLVDSTLWEIPLPVDLALGRYSVVTGLYRTRDLERLPVSASADGTPFLDARVPLDMLTIESS